MNEIEDMIKSLEAFEKEAYAIAVSVAQGFEDLIIDLNVNRQLYDQGIDSDGDSLGEYSERYKVYKRQNNQPDDRVTLRDKGNFHKNFFGRFVGENITIGSTDAKAPFLEAGYGKAIYGLTDASLQEFINTMKPDFIDEAKRQIIDG